MKSFYSLLILFFLFTSCKSNKETIYSAEQDAKENTTENVLVVKEIKQGGDLTSQLRGISGVMIKGSGPSATITIRGIRSLSLTNQPLFTIDGRRFNGSYSSLYNSISVNEIKSINVLKDSASLGFYGSSGANGVIEIITKNKN